MTVGLFLVLICYGALDLHRFLQAMETRKPTLKRWLPYAAELGSDDLLYQHHPDYLYPPVFLVLMKPLTWVSPTTAAVMWQLGKYASVLALFALSWRLIANRCKLPTWVKIGSVVLSVRFVVSDLSHGNINLFMALLVIIAATLLADQRPLACGLCIALAASIKVTPALWAAYLVYKRAWWGVAGVIIGLVLTLGVIPLIALSPARNVTLLCDWYQHVVAGYVSTGEIYSQHMNQSMAAVTNRLFGRGDLATDGVIVTICHLSPITLRWLQRASAVGLLAVLGWSCRGRMPQLNHYALAVEWSLVAAASLALSGYTWTGHFSHLVIAHTVVLAYLADARLRGGDKPVMVLTIVAFTLCSLTGDNLTRYGREWASAVGALFIGMLVLAAALLVIRERLRHCEQS